MGLDRLIAKALGISDEEIVAESMDPETAEILKTAEELIDDVKSGRISKRDFDAEERKKAASEGAAMPDGSFPIKNETDLKNAVQALGRAKNPDAAKAHIIKRARALNAVGSLPDDWQVKKSDESTSEVGTVEDVETEEITIEELDERIDSIEESLAKLPAEIAKAMKDKAEEDETPTATELNQKLDKLAKTVAESVEKLGSDIEKLGEGDSSQGDDDDEPAPEAVAKAYKDRNLDPDLAGIF